MSVSLTTAGSSPGRPAQNLGVEIDDNGWGASWQTSGGRVGRFGRALHASEQAALKRALAAAKKSTWDPATAPEPVWSSGGSTEHLRADGLPALALDPNAPAPKGYGGLLRVLRTLRGDLTDSPIAAVSFEVDGDPQRAQLRHLGTDPVTVQLGTLVLEAHLFGADGALLKSAKFTVEGPADPFEIGPGWAFALGAELGLPGPEAKQMMVARVEITSDVLGDGLLRRSELSWVTQR